MKAILAALLTAILLSAITTTTTAASRVLLDLKPLSRVDSDETITKRRLLNPQERTAARITIVEIDGKYYWASREHRELIHISGGAVHYFISPEGSGAVKVIDSHFLFHDPKDTRPRWKVVEQVGIMTSTITYWGETSEFRGEDLE